MVLQASLLSLILPVPCIVESCVEIEIDLNFCFHTSLWCLKRFREGTTKNCENKNLSGFLFQYNFQQCKGREELRRVTRLEELMNLCKFNPSSPNPIKWSSGNFVRSETHFGPNFTSVNLTEVKFQTAVSFPCKQ